MVPLPADSHDLRGRYVWLWLFGLALGWFEGAVVVYLREMYYPTGFHFPVVIIPARLGLVEVIREAASLILLAAAARLAGRSFLERFAAFMIVFGLWDLMYYVVLKIVLGWPEGLATWDILFLIPLPWVGPVWAPCLVALALVAVGSYLYCTPERRRAYRRADWSVGILAGFLVVASFLAEGGAVAEQRVPRVFPSAVFWTGWVLGVSWFLFAEMRERRRS